MLLILASSVIIWLNIAADNVSHQYGSVSFKEPSHAVACSCHYDSNDGTMFG